MTQLGMTMLGQAGYLWEQGSDHIKSMAIAQGIFSAIGAGATIFSGYISWWEPVFMMLGGGLFVAGFMLCFYAPLYPFILFTLGALTWLMVCVEFMIALPLVALGVTHPEGHDFLGKAEIALMLTLSACLRPVLMIFGYIGGMVMSFIGFSAVNYMFSSVMVFVFGNMYLADGTKHALPAQGTTPTVFQSIFGVVTNDWTGATSQANSKSVFSGNETTDMLLIPLLMVFYGYIVVEIVHYCFTMIHQLPDQVLRWIGGPVQQDRTQGVADKIKSGVQSAAKQAGDMGGKGAMGEGKASGGAIGGSVGGGIQVGMDIAKMAAAGG
jgi:defect-in-organelle-trafficking protein DotA